MSRDIIQERYNTGEEMRRTVTRVRSVVKKMTKRAVPIVIVMMLIAGCRSDIPGSSGDTDPQDKIQDTVYTDPDNAEPVIKLKERTQGEDTGSGAENKVNATGTGSNSTINNQPVYEKGDNTDSKNRETGEAEVGNTANNSGPDPIDIKDNEFYITEITDDIFTRIEGKSFKEDCTLPREDLRYLHVLHKDINGVEHEGEMIVNKHIAEDVLDILRELYENDYPIEKIRLVDEYGADDELSMEDNNSSCFNFRFVPRTTRPSKHGLGLAVDINTLYNPYITTVNGKRNIDPVNAGPYADREADFDYKLEKGDLCYNLFIEHGFTWGGEWKNSKDYQHFEIPDAKIKEWGYFTVQS